MYDSVFIMLRVIVPLVPQVIVGIQSPSSYQFNNWLVIPAAGVLAVKLSPLAAVFGTKFPLVNTASPVPFGVSVIPMFVSDPVAAITGFAPVAALATVISLTADAVVVIVMASLLLLS